MKIITKFWIGIVVLILLSPLGIILPEYFKAGSAWGEWNADKIQKFVGYVPRGLEKLSNLWNAPFSEYMFKGWERKGLGSLSLAYISSAVIGIIAVVLVIFLLGKFLSRKD